MPSELLVLNAQPVIVPDVKSHDETDLIAVVKSDKLIPFTVKDVVGNIRIKGNLQDRVVKSKTTGHLHFAQRIILENVASSEQDAICITGVTRINFPASKKYWVGWRPDGLGHVQPYDSSWCDGGLAYPGVFISFSFYDIDPYSTVKDTGCMSRMSKFYYIKTESNDFDHYGFTYLHPKPLNAGIELEPDPVLQTARPIY